MVFNEEFVPITPVNFFQLSAECHLLSRQRSDSFPSITKQNFRKYQLPDTAALCAEESFVEVAMGWMAEGLELMIKVDSPFKKGFYPDVTRGDSVELFIDTRDVKTSGFNTRFCHHFFFLAEGVEGHMAGELTHFRTEDVHPLCDADELKVKALTQKSNYVLNIFIPSNCLHGYDPEQFNRLGFTYRVNRSEGFPQHFSVVTDDYQVDQQPSLWASLKLVS